MDSKTFSIGSRESQLAMWQAKYAQRLLIESSSSSSDSFSSFEIKGMTTKGDKDQNTSLSKFSDKGIFTKELDIALLEGNIDCAVHCVKDLPTIFHEDLGIACYLKRGAKNDVVLIDKIRHPKSMSIQQLPKNSIIGTGSLRRQSLLKSLNFDNNISVKGIRGNLNTRLSKLVVNHLYDAIILAQIGVERLGWMESSNAQSKKSSKKNQRKSSSLISTPYGKGIIVDSNKHFYSVQMENMFASISKSKCELTKENDDDDGMKVDVNAYKMRVCPLSMSEFPYAVGQGALGIMCRQKDIDEQNEIYQIMLKLNDFHCEMCCLMERTLLRVLEGGCKVPIAVRCDILMQCPECQLWNSIQDSECIACFSELESESDEMTLKFYLYGLVLSQDGNTKIESNECRKVVVSSYDIRKLNIRQHAQYNELVKMCMDIGESVANKLREQGAQKIIDSIKEDALKELKSKET